MRITKFFPGDWRVSLGVNRQTPREKYQSFFCWMEKCTPQHHSPTVWNYIKKSSLTISKISNFLCPFFIFHNNILLGDLICFFLPKVTFKLFSAKNKLCHVYAQQKNWSIWNDFFIQPMFTCSFYLWNEHFVKCILIKCFRNIKFILLIDVYAMY